MQKKNFFSADDDIIDICKDNVFKAVFTKDTPESQGALAKLVSALIGFDVTIINILANEPPVDNTRDRQIRFDINCKTGSGELINVEMILKPKLFEHVRLEFYAGKLLTGQDIRGIDKGFEDLSRTYQIAIIAKEKLFGDDVIIHTFEYYDPVHAISLGGRNKIITLELSKLGKVARKPTEDMSIQDKWAFYFRYCPNKKKRDKINEIVNQEEGIAMASQVLMEISKDEHERARLLSEYKYQLDRQDDLVMAKRAGIQKGIQKGKLEIIELLENGKSLEEIKKELRV